MISDLCCRNRNGSGYLARQFAGIKNLKDMLKNSYEENLTETAAKAANSVETVKSAEQTMRRQKSRKASVLWPTISKARRTFEKQLHKSDNIKEECLSNLIPSVASDVEHFWSEYMDQANVLLDSKRFEKECKDLNVDPTILATHIVFLGSGTMNRVLRNGIVNTIGSKYRDFSGKFVPDEAMQYALDYEPEKKEKDTTETAD